jgi:iron only hydrogenase large subunit-like protein
MMEIELTKRFQKRMIENTLEMLKKMCPDWVVYAEPKESFIKTERDTDEASRKLRAD